MKLWKTSGMLALAGAIAVTTVACKDDYSSANFNAKQTKQIQMVVQDYLVKHPEIIVKAANSLRQKQQMQAIQQTQKSVGKYAKQIFSDKTDPVVGNPKGTVTLVEFFDYQCPHCKMMTPVMQNLVKKNPNLRVVFKELPIFGPASQLATRIALAANAQGKYLAFHDVLMTAKGRLNKNVIMQAAKKAGLDMAKVNAMVKSNQYVNKIKADIALAQKLSLIGTPAFFISKTDGSNVASGKIGFVPGQTTQAALQAMINKVVSQKS